jgi:hypothetical protein
MTSDQAMRRCSAVHRVVAQAGVRQGVGASRERQCPSAAAGLMNQLARKRDNLAELVPITERPARRAQRASAMRGWLQALTIEVLQCTLSGIHTAV